MAQRKPLEVGIRIATQLVKGLAQDLANVGAGVAQVQKSSALLANKFGKTEPEVINVVKGVSNLTKSLKFANLHIKDLSRNMQAINQQNKSTTPAAVNPIKKVFENTNSTVLHAMIWQKAISELQQVAPKQQQNILQVLYGKGYIKNVGVPSPPTLTTEEKKGTLGIDKQLSQTEEQKQFQELVSQLNPDDPIISALKDLKDADAATVKTVLTDAAATAAETAKEARAEAAEARAAAAEARAAAKEEREKAAEERAVQADKRAEKEEKRRNIILGLAVLGAVVGVGGLVLNALKQKDEKEKAEHLFREFEERQKKSVEELRGKITACMTIDKKKAKSITELKQDRDDAKARYNKSNSRGGGGGDELVEFKQKNDQLRDVYRDYAANLDQLIHHQEGLKALIRTMDQNSKQFAELKGLVSEVDQITQISEESLNLSQSLSAKSPQRR